MSGSSQADTKTTTQQLTPDQQSLVNAAMPNFQNFAASNPTLPGGSSIAPFNPNQIAGQKEVLNAAPGQSGVVNTAANTNNEIAGGQFLDPGSNPVVQNAVKAATAPIFDNLAERTLPQIGANASTGAGGISANYGGSRQGIAEGLATKGANEVAGNVGAGIMNTALGQGLNGTLQAIGQAPTTAASLTIPGATTSTVGDVQQQQQQNVMNADTAASQFQQWLPLLKAQMLTQGADALPGGSTTSVGTSNINPSPLSMLIGGASAAGGLAGGLSKLLPVLGFGV